MKYIKFATPRILFIPVLPDQNELKHGTVWLTRDIVEFIEMKTPFVCIPPQCVNMIMQKFEETQEAIRERRYFVPSGDIPKLRKALEVQDAEFTCYSNWSICAFAVIDAEEVFFNIRPYRSKISNTIQVAFLHWWICAIAIARKA
ncbi:hypothetical protein BBJ29_008031 [Phytophthora kernoviae]|uniref:Uncharacterized protein n=1 Tax=Phytophthora kernoviae TaxID=325452 RepID=A0A3F2S0I9_9STRA|nr:hypothetical protein BBJ29_008031 [Phytophthora kernoviae]RLN67054.1 hypothetical protein BBP00_00001826 [Phytophthora kernoviae]